MGQLLRDLRKMRVHGRIILKGDQQNAIVDVLNDVCSSPKKVSLNPMVSQRERYKILKEFARTS